jgi:hypothetical protein
VPDIYKPTNRVHINNIAAMAKEDALALDYQLAAGHDAAGLIGTYKHFWYYQLLA